MATSYYRNVQPNRIAAALAILLLIGCDRGQHPSNINTPAPDFTLTDSAHTAQLIHLRGHTVVLNFWATWCPPCIEELPSLLALQRSMPQITVLAISLDEDEDTYRRFIADHHVDLLTIRDPQQHVNTLYGTSRYPETYVIDRNGILRRKFIGPQNWTSPEIKDYLAKL